MTTYPNTSTRELIQLSITLAGEYREDPSPEKLAYLNKVGEELDRRNA